MAGLTEVPVTIREMSDEEADVFALIENLQREDLNPVEEALGIKSLIETYGFTQEMAADRVGKSRTAVTNTLRLLRLPKEVLDMLSEGKISAGHCKSLLGLSTEKEIVGLAEKTVKDELSVRQIEKMVKSLSQGDKPKTAKRTKSRDKYYDEVEIALSEALGRPVKVYLSKGGKGTIEFEFYGKDDLQKLANELGK